MFSVWKLIKNIYIPLFNDENISEERVVIKDFSSQKINWTN